MDPATLPQLKEKFPKSTAEWRESQLEAGVTLQDAAINYANFLEERTAKLQTELDAVAKNGGGKKGSLGHEPLKEKAGSAKNAAKKADDAGDEGDDEDDDAGQSLETGDAIADFHTAVRRIAGRNPSLQQRQGAIRLVIKRHPDLYRQYLLANNPGKQRARMISEKLEEIS